MRTNGPSLRSSDDTDARRHALALRTLESLCKELPISYPHVGMYLIGSATRETPFPRDLDVLLIDVEASEARNQVKFRRLFDFMRQGNAVEGSFSATDSSFERWIDRVIYGVADEMACALQVTISFAFGPARGEIELATNTLHFHIAGPLTRGDLQVVSSLFPFHAIEFLLHHKALVGPPLGQFLKATSPSLQDLTSWDELLERRFNSAPDDVGRSKWLKQMLRNRLRVPSYVATYGALIESSSSIISECRTNAMSELLGRFVSSAKDLAGSSRSQLEL